ncbi:hypothetical protein I6N95_05155 [Vagococcus sp. BWB3-3]|uniref:Uncharacterized protein n=1 Tax=Vagococcus allomyrinae TaxID=2794353 RepID=A0A940PAD5_9ENTE|nr:hypothetical protein [Vagococcus allomyrinae]MBP1040398.1 hypothetical protein [Vagococcus allomyrinae]
MFIREKRINCGKSYVEVDIFPRSIDQEKYAKEGVRKKGAPSSDTQVNLNDRNSKRKFHQTVMANFDETSLVLGLDYNNEFRPKTVEDAQTEIRNYLDRAKRKIKKLGLPELKWMVVTEHSDGKKKINIHHHLIISGDLGREALEGLWVKGRGKNQKPIGRCNARRLQFDGNGVEGLTQYMLKKPEGKKRWSSSRNLEKPKPPKLNDKKYTRRQLEKYALSNDCGEEMFKKKYPNHLISEIKFYENEMTGYYFYLKMWKKPKDGVVPYHMTKTSIVEMTKKQWIEEQRNNAHYFLCKGGEILASGSIEEIAIQRGVKKSTVAHYGMPSYRRKMKGDGLVLIKQQE